MFNLNNIIFKLKKYPIEEADKQLEILSSLSLDEKETWIAERKWEIAKHHYENNKIYKNIIGGQFPDNWDDIPKITKSDLQGSLQDLITKPFVKKELHIGNTSGSSGHPFYFAKDKYTHALTWAYIKRMYSSYGIKKNEIQARFYGIPLEPWNYRKEVLKDLVLQRERFPVFDLSDQVLDKYLDRFKRKKFTYIYGYTNSIVIFSRYLIKNNIILKEICPTLKLCIVTSEVCTKEDKLILEKAIGIKVVREYGASELCIIAFDQPNGIWQLNTDTVFTETEKNTNNLLCTSLFNKAFPMVKYEIGDIGIIEKKQNGVSELKELEGRTNDNIILPSGKISPGLTFYYISRSILESSGVLKEFIIKQTAINEFIFEVVSDNDLSEDVLKEIKLKAALYLENGLNIKIIRKEYIDRPTSGKIKHFYSLIN
jgi:phenylacetate-CoA ligase